VLVVIVKVFLQDLCPEIWVGIEHEIAFPLPLEQDYCGVRSGNEAVEFTFSWGVGYF